MLKQPTKNREKSGSDFFFEQKKHTQKKFWLFDVYREISKF